MSNEEDGSWNYRSATDLELSGSRRLRSELREVGLVGASLHGLARILTRIFLSCFVRLRAVGTENIPEDASFIIVANHSSHLDALLISSVLPARFTGKFFSLAAADYFFDTPSKTVFATRWVNALPLRRGTAAAKALGGLRERLVAGDCIFIVFPEGTRSRDGKMKPFKPGIGMLVAGTSVPILPCFLEGAHQLLPPDKKFPRPGEVTAYLGEPLKFEETENGKGGWQEIRTQIEEAVRKLDPRQNSSLT